MLRRHWRGEDRLGVAFWRNFVLPGMLMLLLHSGSDRLLKNLVPAPGPGTVLTWLFIAVLWLVVCWQVVGLLRCADRFMVEGGDRTLALGTQGIGLLALLLVLILSVDSYQALQQRNQLWHWAELRNQPDDFTIRHLPGDATVRVGGSLEIGVTYALTTLLDLQPGVSRVVLDSDGGRVYEGRALLKLFRQRGLDTHIEGSCYSACAIAFLGGLRRSMSDGAKVGFHQYRSYTVQPNVDVEAEQQKDIALFLEQGVNADFARAVFTVSSEDIWVPTVSELRAFGVLTP